MTRTMRPSNLWVGKHICIVITGASRGLGRQLAITFAQHFNECHKCGPNPECTQYSLSFVLISRNVAALQSLCQEISAMDCHIRIVDIICGSLDDTQTVESFERTCETIANNQIYDQMVLVHNAGSLGDVNQLTVDYGTQSKPKICAYLDLNLFSVMQLTGIFLKTFREIPHKNIINITSLAAVSPFKGLSLYCIGKAARDSFFRSVAHENESVRVLSYAPGPLETDMVDVLRSDGYLTDEFSKMQVLKPETTAQRLIQILEENRFTSGDHIDYFSPTSP